MSLRPFLLSAAGCLLLAVMTALVFEVSFERAAVLAPVLVLALGAVAGVAVLWTRVLLETVRRRRRLPRE